MPGAESEAVCLFADLELCLAAGEMVPGGLRTVSKCFNYLDIGSLRGAPGTSRRDRYVSPIPFLRSVSSVFQSQLIQTFRPVALQSASRQQHMPSSQLNSAQPLDQKLLNTYLIQAPPSFFALPHKQSLKCVPQSPAPLHKEPQSTAPNCCEPH